MCQSSSNIHSMKKLLIVGSFPRKKKKEHGGVLTVCQLLLDSSLPQRVNLLLVDSSSPSVPPPGVINRGVRASARLLIVTWHYLISRPDVVLLFASPGTSHLEKTVMATIGHLFFVRSIFFPQGGRLLQDATGSGFKAKLLRYTFHIPDQMLCQGKAYQNFFMNETGLTEKQCPIINNWTATQELLNIGEARVKELHHSDVGIIFLGWVAQEKGIYELLECALCLSRNDMTNGFKLIIAGDGSAMQYAHKFVIENSLQDKVELLGWIDSEEKSLCLKKSHILVLPSYAEGMPNAVIEAMAAGLAVVATDVGEVRSLIQEGVNGFVVPVGDIDRLTDAVGQLLIDSELRFKMGQAGWDIARQNFSTEPLVDRLVQLVDSL